jgi:ATP:corrinoid adenosyltransferase
MNWLVSLSNFRKSLVASYKAWREAQGELPSWWTTIKGMVYQTKGAGPSMTKGAYGFVCLVMGAGLLILVRAFCKAYLADGKADPIFAGVITLWAGLFMGFASSAQIRKNTQQIMQKGANNDEPAGKV